MTSPFAPTAIAFARAAAAATAKNTGMANNGNNARMLQAFRRIVRSRESARRFEPHASVPDRAWRDILEMTMTSPSGFNLQPTHVILLRCPRIKAALSEHAMLGFGNQYRTKDASAIAVFCADLEPSKRVDRIFQMERDSGMRPDGYLAVLRVAASFLTGEGTTASITGGGGGGSSTHLSTFLKQTFTHALSPVQPMPTMENVESWSYKNAGIVAQTYTMAATAHGLKTCMMEGYDARRAKEILRVPERYGIPLMVATGYGYGEEPAAHGLKTCMMEGYDARRAKEILRVPKRYGIPLMVATGYGYGEEPV
eukprot:CAMPEP_0181119198 /NCGR_PEP_ID=MMETSP1071-20121207/23480_1 /TAXON_ID=35127 /ORGANISM="Thalassiosira sp., Strain NH16" /LENGTH=310 /DNA_ID=CAMNT_0023203741 /DNA_START=10 /DNA_END=938 /DNA_ORIENTATION=+